MRDISTNELGLILLGWEAFKFTASKFMAHTEMFKSMAQIALSMEKNAECMIRMAELLEKIVARCSKEMCDSCIYNNSSGNINDTHKNVNDHSLGEVKIK